MKKSYLSETTNEKNQDQKVTNAKPKSSEHKKKISEAIKKIWSDPKHKYNSVSYKEKHRKNTSNRWKDPLSIYHTKDYRNKLSQPGEENGMFGKKHTKETKYKMSLSQRPTINYYRKKYSFFCKIEDIRENLNEKEYIRIQVKCKQCKEWFTPNHDQLQSRIYALEKEDGNEGIYFYCSEKCKSSCKIYRKSAATLIKLDEIAVGYIPENLYTSGEYNTWRQEVLKRANNKCEYCGEVAEHCHHMKPQKLEPFFSLDPDYGVACCKDCHYKYGHPAGTECSTGNLSYRICL